MRGTVVGGGGSGTDCPQAITPSITMAHTLASTNRFRFCNLASCYSFLSCVHGRTTAPIERDFGIDKILQYL